MVHTNVDAKLVDLINSASRSRGLVWGAFPILSILQSQTSPSSSLLHTHIPHTAAASKTSNIWLVVLTVLNNISQWEGLSHIVWKRKHVPYHQPDIYWRQVKLRSIPRFPSIKKHLRNDGSIMFYRGWRYLYETCKSTHNLICTSFFR